MRVRRSGGRARGELVHFALPPFYFHGLVEVEKTVSAALILSGGVLSIHANG